MEANLSFGLIGNYHVSLIDSRTGQVKKEHTFHNIAIKNIAMDLFSFEHARYKKGLNLAVGTGTTTPQFGDERLKAYLWTTACTFTNSIINNGKTLKSVTSVTFPATEEYVNNSISELGIYRAWDHNAAGIGSANFYYTHALFTDTEGNPIIFSKTSFDILKIDVEIQSTMSSSDENFKMFDLPLALRSPFDDLRRDATYRVGLFKYDEDKNYYGVNYNKIGQYLDAVGCINDSTDNDTKTCSFNLPSIRFLNTSVTSETYYKGMYIQELGCFMFPNEENLPKYDIKNISIGVGDGETKIFNNPLSYFCKDTEIIKVNNVPLVRDVDYTINNCGNVNKKFELCQNSNIIANSSLDNANEIWKDCNLELCSMFKPTSCTKKLIKKFSNQDCYGINNENPVVLDFGEEKTFNFIKGFNVRLLRKAKSNGSFSMTSTTATVYIDSSDDGEIWNEVSSAQISSNSINKDFDSAITARYWRIRTNQVNFDATYDYIIAILPSSQTVYTEDCGVVLGYYNPEIVFTNAPAIDDQITMDVKMDILMKNDKFTIDLASSFSFTFE